MDCSSSTPKHKPDGALDMLTGMLSGQASRLQGRDTSSRTRSFEAHAQGSKLARTHRFLREYPPAPSARGTTAANSHRLTGKVKVAPAQMDGQGSRGEQLGKLRAEREAKAIMPGKLRAEREAKAIMKLAGRDKSQWCNYM
ncbi:hypothetical protein THAOC_16206 [Thalassiosira oceanica]|uniref:Uncharacterized protein n=1 Tax=Thalassiosira oceanica TaxID=159749 RepID=K0SQ75_THAOC|nr:hypothetical protein THAOC_16206 [Thalassiosira oceanica]|eukprot:EJK63151.1 hypothetical protein THAOC_16206 [Thalassiosira oceanica]